MSSIFNSTFETSLRVLLLLEAIAPNTVSAMRTTAIDFIAVYGREFGIAEANLNGDNRLMYGEIFARTYSIDKAIKSLVVRGLIQVDTAVDGFRYSLTEAGDRYCTTIDDDYANEYSLAANSASLKYAEYSDKDLTVFIDSRAVEFLQGSGTR